MEYWNSLAESLFNDNQPQFGASRALMVGRGLYDTPRHSLYKPKLTALRVIMVERMAKPEEVLVVEKDGEVIREVIKDTDAMEQYKFMRQTLVYVDRGHVDTTLAFRGHGCRALHGAVAIVASHLCGAVGAATSACGAVAVVTLLFAM